MVKLSCLLLLSLLLFFFLLYSYQQRSESDDFWKSVKTVDAPPTSEECDQTEESGQKYFGDDSDDDNKKNIESQTSTTTPSEEVNKAKPFSFINLPIQDHYYYEIAAGIFLLLYSLLYFYGRIQNERIVDAWAGTYSSLFAEQFASASIHPEPVNGQQQQQQQDHETATVIKLFKNSNSEFIYQASGRTNCVQYIATLSLSYRHDLVYLLSSFVFPSAGDQIKIEIPLKQMPPIIFAVSSNKEYHNDFDDITEIVGASTIPIEVLKSNLNSFYAFTDSPELVNTFLNQQVSRTLIQNRRYFISLHFSDLSPFVAPACLQFVFRLPKVNRMEDLRDLMELTIYFTNVFETLKVPERVIERNLELRLKAKKRTDEKNKKK